MSLTSPETLDLYGKYVFGNYGRAPLNIVRGEGVYLWDAEGKRYLDFIPGIGVGALGHCAPRVVAALREQAGQLIHIHNNYHWELQGKLAKRLVEKSGLGDARAFFCNSGTEATEAAIKVARLWGKSHGGKWKIIALENGFHGRTYGALSATGQTALQKGCEPLLPGFSYVPINDIAALEKAFDAETVAFMAEPIQGEGGICPCTREFLQAARQLCDAKGALLLYDEVQAGLGRTGNWFAYQTLGAPEPDVLWTAKALGGGFPIAAMVAKASVAAAMVPGTHGTTYGGNPLACAAALAVFDTIEQDRLLGHVKHVAEQLGAGLRDLQDRYPKKIREVRQVGLMAALDLTMPGKPAVERCRAEGLLINCTHDTVLRFLPPLIIKAAQVDEGLKILDKVLGAL